MSFEQDYEEYSNGQQILTAEALARKFWQLGNDQGREEGYQAGDENGYDQGYNDGRFTGEQDGYELGYSEATRGT